MYDGGKIRSMCVCVNSLVSKRVNGGKCELFGIDSGVRQEWVTS